MDKPVVTIICLTYNHAPYIRDALEGFVCQQTAFPFEVLVHDDASTDGTADIVRDYARRYPRLIKPILQKENQHSRGVNLIPGFCFPLVQGRYVALCEGDDRWTAPTKLQRQVEALEQHPEADLCGHCVRCTRNGHPHGFRAPRLRDCVIPVEEVVKGIPIATASLLCRADTYLQLSPMREVAFLDLSLLLQGAVRGGLVYLSRCMAEYRLQTPNSWTATHRGRRRIEAAATEQKVVEAFDNWTAGRYRQAVRWRLARIDIGNRLTRHQYLTLFSPRRLPWALIRIGRTLCRRFRSLYCQLRWKKSL